jgi:hypothetical protein
VHVSPCQSERTRIPSSGCADTAIRRTGLRASENQTRLPNSRPSSNTEVIFAPGRLPDQGKVGGRRKQVAVHPVLNPQLRQHHRDDSATCSRLVNGAVTQVPRHQPPPLWPSSAASGQCSCAGV